MATAWGLPRFARALFCVCFAALLSACTPIGPTVLSVSRPLYNEAVQQTDAQQLLLNIVRQRYNEPILFLEVTSITNSSSRSINSSLMGKIIVGDPDEHSALLGGAINEAPVIFYAPNTGEKFVRQMLTPLDLRTVALVLQAGWSMERVLLLSGESVNRLRNVGVASSVQPISPDFQMLAAALRDLQKRGLMTVGIESGGKDVAPSVLLSFAPDAAAAESYKKVCAALAVPCDGKGLRLGHAVGGGGDKYAAALATRSLFSSIYFLSQGVDVPAADVEAGVAEPAPNLTGGPFAADAAQRLFHVQVAKEEPKKASVKVFYRGMWFYIGDDDTDSKVTFALLSMLVTLQNGDVTKTSPLVSLPVM